MRALISLIAGSMLLNLSAHAISNTKKNESNDDGYKISDEDESDTAEEIEARGFEYPRAYENQIEN